MACSAVVHTTPPYNITSTSAWSGGFNISTTNNIVEKGIVWNTSPIPTTSDHTVTSEEVYGTPYDLEIPGLSAGTTYYVRAYVDNGCVVAYGEEWSFQTLSADSSVNRCSTKTITINEGDTYVLPKGAQIINASNLSSVTSDCNLNLPIQSYEQITIGNQVWMKKNLTVTTYRNGDPIKFIEDPGDWADATVGAWCYYDGDSCSESTYGILYNWFAMKDPRGLAPLGWHIPTQAEYTSLSDYLGGNTISGGKMKSTKYWTSPNTGGTNSSGWNGIPAGRRNGNTGTFEYINDFGWWWFSDTIPISSDPTSVDVSAINLRYDTDDYAITGFYDKQTGYSVRCIKG